MKDCTTDICEGDNRIKNCQCYRNHSGGMYDQICAYEENGFLIPCNAGCCNEGKGCPGQCKGAIDAPPYRSNEGLKTLSEGDIKIDRTINAFAFLVIALTIISTSLLILSFLNTGLKKKGQTSIEPTNGYYGFPFLRAFRPPQRG